MLSRVANEWSEYTCRAENFEVYDVSIHTRAVEWAIHQQSGGLPPRNAEPTKNNNMLTHIATIELSSEGELSDRQTEKDIGWSQLKLIIWYYNEILRLQKKKHFSSCGVLPLLYLKIYVVARSADSKECKYFAQVAVVLMQNKRFLA